MAFILHKDKVNSVKPVPRCASGFDLIKLVALCSCTGLLFVSSCFRQEPAEIPSVPVTAAQEDLNSGLVFAGEGVLSINPLINVHDELPGLIFSGLLKHDLSGKVVPDLCSSFDYDPNALRYTFHLKDGVYWHDGTPFTAADVVFTYQKLCFDQSFISPARSNYLDIKNVTATDPQTVVMELSAPNAALPGYLCIGILPEHLLKDEELMTSFFNQQPVGTGRYQFKEWDRAAGRIELVVNAAYYGKVPAIKHITYCTTADESNKSLLLRSGKADLAWLNAEDAAWFRTQAEFENIDFKTADLRTISMDFRTPFWQRNRDSIAPLNYAIDKDALVQSVLSGRGIRAWSPLQPHKVNASHEIDIYPFSLDKFHAAMASLGWVKGADGIYVRNGERFSFSLQVREYEAERVALAQICASMLKDAGVEMRVQLVPHFDFTAGYNACLYGIAAQYDPDQYYSVLVSGMSDNVSGYSNPEVDTLLKQGRRELDPIKRARIYQDFELAFSHDPAFIPLVYIDGNYVSINGLYGLDDRMLLGHHAAGVFRNVEEWTLSR